MLMLMLMLLMMMEDDDSDDDGDDDRDGGDEMIMMMIMMIIMMMRYSVSTLGDLRERKVARVGRRPVHRLNGLYITLGRLEVEGAEELPFEGINFGVERDGRG